MGCDIHANADFKNMTYEEFKDWCNKRACDGQWSMNMARYCISVMQKINAIKAKGLFQKKKTIREQELAWQQLVLGTTL